MYIDINECLSNMDNCSQVCTNTEGGFTCSCRDGYTLGEDGTSCEGAYLLEICIAGCVGTVL